MSRASVNVRGIRVEFTTRAADPAVDVRRRFEDVARDFGRLELHVRDVTASGPLWNRCGHRRACDARCVSILRRVLGRRSFERPEPGPQDIARVDVSRMIATSRERGDERTDPEVVAALMLGADLTADRHHDPEMRLRGAAAFEACRRWLVDHVGEGEAARLLTESEGPVDANGRASRPR